MECRVCKGRIASSFAAADILSNNVKYYECSVCGYVQTETPTWLSEAYSASINISDTGIMQRNLSNVKLVLATLALLNTSRGRVVDYAGGYGILVRLLRDRGVNAFWTDAYSTNLLARGFEYTHNSESVSLVTAFEVFEHFVDPVEELEKLIAISPNILLSTSVMPEPTPSPTEWWYYGLNHGQHIGFFRVKTLQFLAKKHHLQLLTDGKDIHLLSKIKYSAARWHLLKLIAKINPRLLAFRLKSKTWSDHLWLTKS